MPGPCPTPERLAAALRGRQPGGGDAELAAHLAECPACQARLESLAGGTGWLEAKAKTHQATVSNAEPLRRAMSELETNANDIPAEASSPPNLDFLQPASQPGVLGRFGPYEVIAHIASGGMGIVLKARDPALNRIVALKILPPALAANSLARARFVREARAAAAVVHEHVVPIYAVDEWAGLPYLVMQFVQGRSLSERIRTTGPLRLEEILRIGAQTAAGLAAAHAQGLVHRDVKPGNILLENSVERVKLTDFGLARAVDDAGLTRTGELAGTPEFMAPEQAGNEAVDHRSDLFSFGSVLYAMCTGCSPFQASSVIAAVRKVCDEQPPPVQEVNPAIPHWFSDIVARLMAKSPAERFQSAREVGELLERYLARVQHGELSALPDHWVQPAPTRRRLTPAYAVGALLLLAAVGVLMFALKGHRVPSPTAGPQAASQPAFEVRNPGDTNVQKYSTLAAAISASGSEAVIEVGVNGPFEVEGSVVDHPLILRSAVGCRPVLVRRDVTSPILLARAPLVIEGLTFQDGETAAQENDAPAVSRKAGGPRGPMIRKKEFIFVEGTALFLSNCRLIMLGPAGPRLPAVQLQGALRCEFQNCELFTPDTASINLKTASGRAGKPPYAIVLRNCIWFARRALVGEFSRAEEGTMDLERNTFASEVVFNWSVLPAGKLVITANSNLFDVETMMSRGLPPRMGAVAPPRPNPSPVSEKTSWREQGNFYSVRKFSITSLDGSQSEPELKDLTAWLKYWQATGTSRTGKALVASKVKARQSDPDKLSPNDFRLEGIRADDEGIVNGIGADVELVGPGANYDRWRATPAYAEWARLIKAALASQ